MIAYTVIKVKFLSLNHPHFVILGLAVPSTCASGALVPRIYVDVKITG
jgi:hypothetical protein